jgi:hypothetical protein
MAMEVDDLPQKRRVTLRGRLFSPGQPPVDRVVRKVEQGLEFGERRRGQRLDPRLHEAAHQNVHFAHAPAPGAHPDAPPAHVIVQRLSPYMARGLMQARGKGKEALGSANGEGGQSQSPNLTTGPRLQAAGRRRFQLGALDHHKEA